MVTYLDKILSFHRDAAARDGRDLDHLRERALQSPIPRPFKAHLQREGLSVIAEVKRRSPSKGELGGMLDETTVAHDYEKGGASAISVLTDSKFFDGSAEDLISVRSSCELPVLRKDFCVDMKHILDARIMGADAVLLIAAALTDDELSSFSSLAKEMQLAALIEVHDEAEALRALDVGAEIVGINQRDLKTFAVDTKRAIRVGAELPESVLKVAESGVRGVEDARVLYETGFDAVLVGEYLMTSSDRESSVRALAEIGSNRRVPR